MTTIGKSQTLFPGVLISGLIALAAQFISEHYGAPAMLMALLFGIALNFLSEDGPCKDGIGFAAKTVLRLGVALLGMRVSFDMAADLGWPTVLLVVGSVLITIAFGIAIARFLGHGPRFAFLSAGSVAICGASAAMAIAAILPRDERSEERLVFTVVGVTLMSTLAMIAYPILAETMEFGPVVAGVFLGATIHDVAQVVGAGFSISEQTGDVATVVKLIRVAMLAPIILVASLLIRRLVAADEAAERPAIVPTFVVGFVVLVALNSFGVFPEIIREVSAEVSRWALLTAIAAVGLKTSLREVANVGKAAIAMLVIETAFLAAIVLLALRYLALS